MARSRVRESAASTYVTRRGLHTSMEFMALSEKGVTKRDLRRLAGFFKLSTSDMAKILPITERTIQRYAPQRRFSRLVSEHILDIERVAMRGLETFGEQTGFLSWIDRPSIALGNRKPMALLASRFGIELILDELGRIEHGIVS